MVALLAALALAGPPAAYVQAGAGRVPLAVSSWCRANRCGAPIAASRRVAVVPRGSLVRCVFGFVPKRVSVSVGGKRIRAVRHGDEVEWRVERGGGLTVTAIGAGIWATYVGRLRFA